MLKLLLVAAMSIPIQCGPSSTIIKRLVESYHEQLMFTARGGRLPIHLYINLETGTWTLIYIPAPDIACMVAAGDHFKPFDGEQPFDSKKPSL